MFSDDLLKWIRTRKEREARIDGIRREVIIENLIFVYHACVASEQLLSLGAHQSLKKGPFYKRLRKYYQQHLEEEKDEVRILREDLISAQVPPRAADPIVMAMVGTQYYLLYHVQPVCLLGYLLVAETDPMPLESIEKLETLHGFSWRFLRMHADKDLEHAQELTELLETVPEELQAHVRYSAGNVLDYVARAARKWNHPEKTYG